MKKWMCIMLSLMMLCGSLPVSAELARDEKAKKVQRAAAQMLSSISEFDAALDQAIMVLNVGGQERTALDMPIFSNGRWIYRIALSDLGLELLLYATGKEKDAAIVEARILSIEQMPSYDFAVACSLVRMALHGKISADDWLAMLDALASDEPLQALDAAFGMAMDYTFSHRPAAIGYVGVFTAQETLALENSVRLDDGEAVSIPFQQPDMTVRELVDALGKLYCEYTQAPDGVIVSVAVQPQAESTQYNHVYIFDQTYMSIVAADDTVDAKVEMILLSGMDGRADQLIICAQFAFAAVAGLSMSQFYASAFADGGEGTYDAYMAFMPAAAWHDKMLLFSSHDMNVDGNIVQVPTAYIVGLPDDMMLSNH